MVGKRWSDWEVEFLRENWGKLKIQEIAERLGRTGDTVKWKAKTLGLPRLRREWTEEELKFLRENYGKLPDGEIAERLGRSKGAVTFKALTLGLRKMKVADDKILKAIGKVYVGSMSDLASKIPCSKDFLLKALRRLRAEGKVGFTRFTIRHRHGKKYSSHKLFGELSHKIIVWTDREALIGVLADKLKLSSNLPRYFKKTLTYRLRQILPTEIFEEIYELYR